MIGKKKSTDTDGARSATASQIKAETILAVAREIESDGAIGNALRKVIAKEVAKAMRARKCKCETVERDLPPPVTDLAE